LRFEPIFEPFVLAFSGVACSALVPTSAFAVDYLSADQAARLMFPDADRFEAAAIDLDAPALQRLSAQGLRARSAHWPVQVARQGSQTLGYVVADAVLGKFELIGYAVGLAPDGSVRGVEVLSYRESHGAEIRNAAWRRQFVGKGTAAPLQVGQDIANISGATLSCSHLTEGVRRIVAVVAQARHDGGLP
jgi:Na+-transporting NADH:ubiquinone oxidoreductase subunit NqrC